MSFRAWAFESYLRLLQYLGMAPKDLEKITSKLKTLEDLDSMESSQYPTPKHKAQERTDYQPWTLKRNLNEFLPEAAK